MGSCWSIVLPKVYEFLPAFPTCDHSEIIAQNIAQYSNTNTATQQQRCGNKSSDKTLHAPLLRPSGLKSWQGKPDSEANKCSGPPCKQVATLADELTKLPQLTTNKSGETRLRLKCGCGVSESRACITCITGGPTTIVI